MSLSEKSRSAIYTGLQAVVDEEAVQEMLSYFPARDVEEPVTKDFLRAELAFSRVTLSDELRTEFRGEMAELRSEFRGEMAELRAAVRTQTQWLVGMMITLSGLIIGVVTLVR